jgi:hypothetical protein
MSEIGFVDLNKPKEFSPPENFKIEMLCLDENQDGSIDVKLNMDGESAKYLISYGFIHMLKEAIKEGKLNTVNDET